MTPNDWDNFMATLRQEYLESLDEKISIIREFESLNSSAAEVSNFYHKLKGSGATYGFKAISEMGEALEEFFKTFEEAATHSDSPLNHIDSSQKRNIASQLKASREFLTAIKTFYNANPLSEDFPTRWISVKNSV